MGPFKLSFPALTSMPLQDFQFFNCKDQQIIGLIRRRLHDQPFKFISIGPYSKILIWNVMKSSGNKTVTRETRWQKDSLTLSWWLSAGQGWVQIIFTKNKDSRVQQKRPAFRDLKVKKQKDRNTVWTKSKPFRIKSIKDVWKRKRNFQHWLVSFKSWHPYSPRTFII